MCWCSDLLSFHRCKATRALMSKSLVPLSKLCPTVPKTKVSDVKNPKGDGNCGFRCLAMALYDDEELYGDVKSAMLDHLVENKNDYLACGWLTPDDLPGLEKILRHRGDCPDNSYYYSDPECSQLAADAFERPVEFHGSISATLYLPFIRHTLYKSYRPIVLNLDANHIYFVTMKKGSNHGYPKINMMHNSVCEKLNIPNLSASFS